MSQQKITSQVLAEKIASFINEKYSSGVDVLDVLAGVPELKGFDRLTDAVETAHRDCLMALENTWDRGDEGFQATRDNLAECYKEATGAVLPDVLDSEEEEEEPEAEQK